jgi:hypothetical protein
MWGSDYLREDPCGITSGHIVTGETDEAVNEKHIALYDPPEMIEFCQTCPKADCSGRCPYAYAMFKREVAEKVLYGWRTEVLAQQYGLQHKTIQKVVREARKEGLL